MESSKTSMSSESDMDVPVSRSSVGRARNSTLLPKKSMSLEKISSQRALSLKRSKTGVMNDEGIVKQAMRARKSIDLTQYNAAFMDSIKKRTAKLVSIRPKRQQLFYIFHLICIQRRFSYNTFMAIRY